MIVDYRYWSSAAVYLCHLAAQRVHLQRSVNSMITRVNILECRLQAGDLRLRYGARVQLQKMQNDGPTPTCVETTRVPGMCPSCRATSDLISRWLWKGGRLRGLQ